MKRGVGLTQHLAQKRALVPQPQRCSAWHVVVLKECPRARSCCSLFINLVFKHEAASQALTFSLNFKDAPCSKCP